MQETPRYIGKHTYAVDFSTEELAQHLEIPHEILRVAYDPDTNVVTFYMYNPALPEHMQQLVEKQDFAHCTYPIPELPREI